jgi:hypothetical protein
VRADGQLVRTCNLEQSASDAISLFLVDAVLHVCPS